MKALLLLLAAGLAAPAALAMELALPWSSLRPVHTLSHKDATEVLNVPGYPKNSLPSKHYAGYVEVDESHGRNLYYYLVTAEKHPETAPLVLWLNGGPGCSSFDGFVKEHGPFKVSFKGGKDADGSTVQKLQLDDNPYTWAKVANMLYVDSPAGVGMSYSKTPADYETNDDRTIADLHTFLLRWLARYPEFQGRNFYVAGESYAGVYVPLLVRAVLDGNAGLGPDEAGSRINIQGYLAGNPSTDTYLDANAVPEFLVSKSLINKEIYERAVEVCGGNFVNNTDNKCMKMRAVMDDTVRDINHYDILDSCYKGSNPYRGDDEGWPRRALRTLRTAVAGGAHRAGLLAARVEEQMELGHTPRCLDQREMWAFCNDAKIREAIHARPISEIGAFDECTNGDRIRYTSQHSTMIPVHKELLDRGMRALIYSGDHDMVIPHTSTEAWVADLGVPERWSWMPWRLDDGRVAGFAGHFAGIIYATVIGAGHAVPESRPEEALSMFAQFLEHGHLS